MSKLKFDANTPLYTTGPDDAVKAWRMEDAAAALSEVYSRGLPVVVFVHGRGKEPNKSLHGATFAEGLAVWKIELGYPCRVLMFNWDSAFPGLAFLDRSRPLANAIEGGRRLVELLQALAAFGTANPAMPKPVLLAHSMGSIVVQRAVQTGKWPPTRVFKQVVFSEPDADDVGHVKWMTALGAIEQVYSTFNEDDKVLKRSTDDRPTGAHALGLGTAAPLAPNVSYIDLTSMGTLGAADDDHEVFGKSAMNGQLNVCTFFEQAILGKEVVLDDRNVVNVSKEVVFKLKQRTGDKNSPCLKVPDLPHFGH